MVFSLERLIGAHTIPINTRNLTDLANRFRTNIHPDTERAFTAFSVSFLRPYGTQIAVMSTVIDMQLQRSVFQIEYGNATIKYTVVTMIPSMLVMFLSSVLVSGVALIESILKQIVVEVTLNVINGWLSALIVNLFAQNELKLKNPEFEDDKYNSELKELTNQSGVAGALGGLFGYITFALHNGFLNHLGTVVSSVSNVAASVETSLITAATVAKKYNQKFDPGEAAISGAAMGAIMLPIGAFGMVYSAWNNRPHNRVHRGNPDNIRLEEIRDNRLDVVEIQPIVQHHPVVENNNLTGNTLVDNALDHNTRLEENIPDIKYEHHIQNTFYDSNIRNDIHIVKNQHIYIGSSDNPQFNLVKDYPVLPYTRHIFTDKVEYLKEFISKYNPHRWKYSDYKNETFVFMNCKSSDIVDLAEKQNYHSFITCTAPIKQEGKYINAKGTDDEFILHYKEDGNSGYIKEPLGKNLVNGLARTRVVLNESTHSRFDNAYTGGQYDIHEWGEDSSGSELNNKVNYYDKYINKFDIHNNDVVASNSKKIVESIENTQIEKYHDTIDDEANDRYYDAIDNTRIMNLLESFQIPPYDISNNQWMFNNRFFKRWLYDNEYHIDPISGILDSNLSNNIKGEVIYKILEIIRDKNNTDINNAFSTDHFDKMLDVLNQESLQTPKYELHIIYDLIHRSNDTYNLPLLHITDNIKYENKLSDIIINNIYNNADVNDKIKYLVLHSIYLPSKEHYINLKNKLTDEDINALIAGNTKIYNKNNIEYGESMYPDNNQYYIEDSIFDMQNFILNEYMNRNTKELYRLTDNNKYLNDISSNEYNQPIDRGILKDIINSIYNNAGLQSHFDNLLDRELKRNIHLLKYHIDKRPFNELTNFHIAYSAMRENYNMPDLVHNLESNHLNYLVQNDIFNEMDYVVLYRLLHNNTDYLPHFTDVISSESLKHIQDINDGNPLIEHIEPFKNELITYHGNDIYNNEIKELTKFLLNNLYNKLSEKEFASIIVNSIELKDVINAGNNNYINFLNTIYESNTLHIVIDYLPQEINYVLFNLRFGSMTFIHNNSKLIDKLHNNPRIINKLHTKSTERGYGTIRFMEEPLRNHIKSSLLAYKNISERSNLTFEEFTDKDAQAFLDQKFNFSAQLIEKYSFNGDYSFVNYINKIEYPAFLDRAARDEDVFCGFIENAPINILYKVFDTYPIDEIEKLYDNYKDQDNKVSDILAHLLRWKNEVPDDGSESDLESINIHEVNNKIYIGDIKDPQFNLVKDFPVDIPYIKPIFTDKVEDLKTFISDYSFNKRNKDNTLLFINCKSKDIIPNAEKQGYHSFITSTSPIKQVGKSITADQFILHYKEYGKEGYEKQPLGTDLVEGLERISAITGESIHTRFNKSYKQDHYDEHEWGENYKPVDGGDGFTYYLNEDGNVVFARDSNGVVTFDERSINNNQQTAMPSDNTIITNTYENNTLVKDGDYYIDKDGALYETDDENNNNDIDTQQAIQNSLINQQMTQSSITDNNIFGSFSYAEDYTNISPYEFKNVEEDINIDISSYFTDLNTANNNDNSNYIFKSSIYPYPENSSYISKDINKELSGNNDDAVINDNNKRLLNNDDNDISIKKQIIDNDINNISSVKIKSRNKQWTQDEKNIIKNYLNKASNREKGLNVIYRRLAKLLSGRTATSIEYEIKTHGTVENYNPNIIKSSYRPWSKDERNKIYDYLNQGDNRKKIPGVIYRKLAVQLPGRTAISIEREIKTHGKIENYNPNIIKSNREPWSKDERKIINNYLKQDNNKKKTSRIIYEELAKQLLGRTEKSIKMEIETHGKIENYNPNIIKSSHEPWSADEKDIINNYLKQVTNTGKTRSVIYKELAKQLPNRTATSIEHEIKTHGKIENYNPNIIESNGEPWAEDERNIINNYLKQVTNTGKSANTIYEELVKLLPDRTKISIKEEIKTHGTIENYNPAIIKSNHKLWDDDEKQIINNYLKQDNNRKKTPRIIYEELAKQLQGRTNASIRDEIIRHGGIKNYNPNKNNRKDK